MYIIYKHSIATFTQPSLRKQLAVAYYNIHCYFCRDGCVKCNNVVECALLACALCQPVTPSIPIPTSARFLLEKCLKILLFFLQKILCRYCSTIILRPIHPWLIISSLHGLQHAQHNWRPAWQHMHLLRDHQKMLNVDYSFTSN